CWRICTSSFLLAASRLRTRS
uniref:Uncharacterized protein n=1 Tax=Xenopus tropicalis TaxID=8364 RepID=A0A6I8SMK1_XENTR